MVYDIALKLYSTVAAIVGLFNKKARLWHKGRVALMETIESSVVGGEDIIWFHCASLGEFEQGRPLMERYRRENPSYKVLVTFFSPSGYEVRKGYDGADYIFYLPIDTRKNAKRFVEAVRPKIAIFVKYEFWKNYLEELRKNNAKVYIISAIFRPGQLFFHSYGRLYRKQLSCFDYLFVQNRQSKDLLSTIGIENVIVSGDTRFDRVYEIASGVTPVEKIASFCDDRRIFIAGSTWERDDQVVMAIAKENPQIKYIIAPHELPLSKIVRLKESFEKMGRKVKRYTEIAAGEDLSSYDILILDTIGILSSVYQYGSWGYIGGGFGVGIHNILEAATFAMPIMIGPNYGKFREALNLVAIGGAISIATKGEAVERFSHISQKEQQSKMAEICRQYIEDNRGACDKIMSVINQ